MTETVTGHSGSTKRSAAGFRGRKNAPAGLTIERIFTTEGVHPYDEVTWERRDVVQQNWKTGETVFEQRGVEFPDFWSVNASHDRHHEVLPRRGRHRRREWSLQAAASTGS
jgi:ribonucleoside-diphosphate reductase alpha chain